MISRACVLLCIGTAACISPFTAASSVLANGVDFSRDVLPILSAKCFQCHGPDEEARQADLRLDVRAAALAAGSDMPAIVPGAPDQSAVVVRITEPDSDLRMPPADMGAPLSADEVVIIRQWIEGGAKYTEHWSFLKAKRPLVPEVVDAAWAATPIDRFVLSRLELAGLRPAGVASREALIRRATFDLIGLPPTPEEVEAFLADGSPDAFSKLIERLLASPHYGERWGRHWLDVARYADSGGFETDIFFGHAWRYRDYVIRSLNADKPFDRFVKEQIAGDELFPDAADSRTATGLYAIGPVLQEADMVEGKLDNDLLTDAVDTTGAAFLGLTIGCARCHDHKYDPITQRDYYGLQAIFAASDQHDFDETGKLLRGGVALRKSIDEFKLEQMKARAHRTANAKQRDKLLREIGGYYIEKDRELRERLEQSEAYAALTEARERYDEALATDQPSAKLDELLLEIGQQVQNLRGQDRRARRAFRQLTRAERDARLVALGRENLALAVPEGLIEDAEAFRREIGARHLAGPSEIPVRGLAHRNEPLMVRLLRRGEVSDAQDIVAPAFPKKFDSGRSISNAPSAKWRAALAEWVASNENPLTARVIVNRVWQWHFGEGLVRTPNDFGIRGDHPTHPELLDWLAVNFMDHGWSLKHLHRTIMLSNSYQMASAIDERILARDPDNRLLTRYQPRRLEAEAIWDSVRAVSGTLNREMYGLPIAPPLDAQEEIGNYKDWPTSTPDELNRRGIYLLTRRSFRFPMLSSFDLPDNAVSCGRRDITTVPNQCLALLNNRTMNEQAAAFAERLVREAGGDCESAVPLMWRYAYGRELADPEREVVLKFLKDRQAELVGQFEDASQRALAEMCLAIFNTNEFIYVQ